MSTINGKVCVVDGVAVDKVFSDGRQVYGRNLIKGGAHQTILARDDNYNFRIFYTSLIPNKTYTLSMIGNLKGSSDNLFTVNLYGNDLGLPAMLTHNILADGTARKWQFTVPNGGMNLIIYAGKQGSTSGIGLDLKNLKLETGDQTPWSPAPEDVLKGDITAPNNLVESQSYLK